MQILLLKQPYAVSLSGMPMPYSFVIAPYNVAASLQNLRILVRTLIEDSSGSNNFIEAHSEVFYPDGNGQINTDIKSIINPYLSYYLPNLSLPKMVPADGQYKNYRVGYCLQKDGVAISTETLSPILGAIKGGMAMEEWHPTEIFTNYIQSQKNFLCYTTPREKTFAMASSFLFFLAPIAGSYTCQVSLVDDGGQPYVLNLPNAITLQQNAIACLPSGYTQLDLHSILPAGKFPVKYTVTINNASVGLVARRVFALDARNFYNPSTLCYRNSLGGLETVVLRGAIDFEADYAIQQAQSIVPPAYFENAILMPQFSQTTEESAKYLGDTGFNDRETTNKFRDFMLSKQRLELRNNRWLPIISLNKNVKFFGNRDSLISIQLQWQLAVTNEFFTPAGIMPTFRTCPALESLQVTQSTKSMLQISWAMPIPYDKIQVQIIVGATSYTYSYKGNVGTVFQPFVNPAAAGATATIAIQGRVICDPDALPVPDMGAASTVTLLVLGNSLPVLVNDEFTVNSGLTTATAMANSVLDNDFDPDGDPLVAIAATGNTNAGGTYTIDVKGNVTYMPPTPTYNGKDYVDYQANDGTGTNVTARMFFNVGGSVSGVIFMKSYTKNVTTTTSGYNGGTKTTIGEFWIGAFSDPACQNPLNVTGLGLVVNYLRKDDFVNAQNPNTSVPGSVAMAGTAVQVYQGEIFLELVNSPTNSTTHTVTFPVQAGNGYVAV